MKKMIAGIVAAIVATVGGLYFAGIIPARPTEAGADAADEPVADIVPTYLALEPPFVVNFTHRGTLRYLQVSLELMYQDPALLARVTERMPEVRNDLILLFSNQDYEKLSTMAGKEQLRQEIFMAINDVIGVATADASVKAHDGTTTVDSSSSPDSGRAPAHALAAAGAVYITNFVMQ